MAVRTSATSTIAVSGGVPATYNQAGYAALSWTAIGEVTDLGEFSREYALVTHSPVGNRATQKYKGSFNEGSMTLTMGLDTDDAGQIIVKAGRLLDTPYSFRVTTQNGDIYYFVAQVMSFKVGVGGVDQITQATCVLELTTSSAGAGIVEVLAA